MNTKNFGHYLYNEGTGHDFVAEEKNPNKSTCSKCGMKLRFEYWPNPQGYLKRITYPDNHKTEARNVYDADHMPKCADVVANLLTEQDIIIAKQEALASYEKSKSDGLPF